FQTTSKVFGRKLSKRCDTRRVEVAGSNNFRQTYEMRGSWRKVKRIIDSYILSASDRFLGANRPLNGRKSRFQHSRCPDPPNFDRPKEMMLNSPSIRILSAGDSILTEATAQDALELFGERLPKRA